MIITGKFKNARISSQKIKYLISKIKGLNITKALNILSFSNKKGAFLTKKILKSVAFNAENNYGLDMENMYIHTIYATKGISFKRISTRAKGRSDRIVKRHSHIFVTIKEKN